MLVGCFSLFLTHLVGKTPKSKKSIQIFVVLDSFPKTGTTSSSFSSLFQGMISATLGQHRTPAKFTYRFHFFQEINCFLHCGRSFASEYTDLTWSHKNISSEMGQHCLQVRHEREWLLPQFVSLNENCFIQLRHIGRKRKRRCSCFCADRHPIQL